jgi:hypothetical protein
MAKEHGAPFQRPALLSGGDQHGSRLSVSCCNMHPSDAIDTASPEYPNSASMSQWVINGLHRNVGFWRKAVVEV